MIGELSLDRRLERAGQAVAYLLIGLPIAALAVVGVVTLVIGAALSVTGLGLPLLIAASAGCRALLRLDRRAANGLLRTHIPPLPASEPTSGTPWRRSLDMLSDRALWRVAAALVLRPMLEVAAFAVALAPVAFLAVVVVLAVQAIGDLGHVQYLGPWSFGPGIGLLLCLFALPAAVVAVAVLDGLHSVLCSVTRALLVPRITAAGPVREILAASLGDRSVTVAYWLPDRGAFVDESGHRVEMPSPGSGRTWTAVERDGRPVAAIIHDAALDTSRELVHAAAAASSLAIDNERLKADLRARLEELRVSRLRIVQAADAARRRIERDLHDGAQQQLVALAIELRLLRRRVADEEVGEAIEDLSRRLGEALEELRELARGIHPAVLTDRGLGPALAALTDRAPIEVDLDIDADGRMPAAIEAAAYFLVAEGLTNVVKYAGAGRAQVSVSHEDGELIVTVADDGRGGADPESGSGLRGLQDRLAAVDGTLIVDSPPGGGTELQGRLPCEAPTSERVRA